MRYRALSADFDYQFGHGPADFYLNSTHAVAQAIRTRLLLWLGEWFVDPSDGTPWLTQITGAHTQGIRDIAIKQRILGTPGVLSIIQYYSTLNPATRLFSIANTQVQSLYGELTFLNSGPLSGLFTIGESSLDGSDGLG
jgi:hypothetical protein